MVRILVISGIHPPMWGPEGDHIMHLCQQFAGRGFEVHLLTAKGAQSTGVVHLHNVIKSWGWSALPDIVRVICRVKPDAVMLMYVGWTFKRHPMPTLLHTVVGRINKNIERVTMITNALGSEKPTRRRGRLIWRIASFLVGGADNEFGTLLRDSQRIAILSEHHLRRLVAIDPAVAGKSVLVPPPPILHLSPNTPEVRAKARARFGITDEEIVFTFFGYGYPGKGIETFVAAFALLANRLPNLKIMFAGRIDFAPAVDGRPYKTVLLEPLDPWKSRVIVSEYDATSDEGSTFLRAADVCVLPFDGGVALNNSSVAGASVHGLPIISTTRPDLESAFIDGQNMLLIPPKSPEVLAVAMEKLANVPTLRATLAAGASQLAHEWFSWDRTLMMLFSESINLRARTARANI